ncbi:MAG: DUF4845 domain-containing protein [Spongiibacteraceae bacterium]
MQLRKHQMGMGALGWLIVLGIASFALTCFFRIGPVYLDYWQTRKALDLVLLESQSSGKSREAILAAIQRQFDVSRIETIATKDIKFVDGKKGREVNANYEKRVPLIANIDVVVKFDKLVYNLSSSD